VRAVVVTVVVVYFELPYSVSGWIPVWLPFLLAVVTEAQFFFSGWRRPRAERESIAGRSRRIWRSLVAAPWIRQPLSRMRPG
jgi:hypothetical protein